MLCEDKFSSTMRRFVGEGRAARTKRTMKRFVGEGQAARRKIKLNVCESGPGFVAKALFQDLTVAKPSKRWGVGAQLCGEVMVSGRDRRRATCYTCQLSMLLS